MRGFCKKKTLLFPSGLLCYLFGIESDPPMLPIIRAESSDHCVRINGRIHNIAVFVTKCSEILLLYDKSLSRQNPDFT